MILPIENTERMVFPGVGKYGIPAIEPETDIRIDKLEWIPFNYALTAKDCSAKGVHYKLKYDLKVIRRSGVEYEDIVNMLVAPNRICPSKTSRNGRRSVKLIGTVTIKPNTGALIQTNPGGEE